MPRLAGALSRFPCQQTRALLVLSIHMHQFEIARLLISYCHTMVAEQCRLVESRADVIGEQPVRYVLLDTGQAIYRKHGVIFAGTIGPLNRSTFTSAQ